MRHLCLIVLAILMASAASLARVAGPSDQETIRLLIQQVKELQEKMSALETKQPQPSANFDPSVQVQPLEDSASTMAPRTEIPHEVGRIQWRGFGEVDYKVLNQRTPELGTSGFVPGSAGNFYTGALDLLLTSKISDRTSFLSEIVFDEGDAQSYDLELARILLKYALKAQLDRTMRGNQTTLNGLQTQLAFTF